MASDKVKTFTDGNFDAETKQGVVLVDLWAPWCGPCRAIAPIVDQLAEEYDGKVTIGKLNVDENPSVPARFMVQGIPTLLVLKDGQLADTVVGLTAKDSLAKVLDKQL